MAGGTAAERTARRRNGGRAPAAAKWPKTRHAAFGNARGGQRSNNRRQMARNPPVCGLAWAPGWPSPTRPLKTSRWKRSPTLPE
eukprot:2407652-Lingulodinium_polyedra.AAC.1